MICLEIKAIKHLMLCTPVGKSIQMSQLYIHYPGTIKQGRMGNLSSASWIVVRTYVHLKAANKTLNFGKKQKGGRRTGKRREEVAGQWGRRGVRVGGG